MPSSISVSEAPRSAAAQETAAARAIAVLLALLLLYCGALEFITRAGFSRISHGQRRTMLSMAGAMQLQPHSSSGAPTVLVVGNSLLLHGVEPESLHQKMAPQFESFVFAVENTQYLDWYFGLRRLFSSGSHPAFVVLTLTPRQLISSATDGEYAAHYLTNTADVIPLARRAGLATTPASNLFFANLSTWLGSRAMIRNWLLSELMPNLDELTTRLPAKAGPLPPNRVLIPQSLDRLAEIQNLCRQHGAALIFLIPPTLGVSDLPEALQAEAATRGVPVIVPFRSGELPASDFVDGFHLNARGADAFTAKLAPMLAEAAGKLR
ncbi:MAG TPA: hypothetical protein VJP87_02060 [Candidatus Acidoferrales bacterium]|nr:hypothetical protein [Candidatus Acidoferrales bacterium]